ncbi:ribosome hibernation-promoting factor, HPF/YfiA family [Naumannella cuiyingiana]|uniref:Ribosome hibernation promoting factor n=1 Tax=Naumannella cuiyingiana TaxID=1347891 RepID=A0A7Z0IJS7_9ACTN|nr:ribosome-associated translation inhibitor RaiA [Naumannella cuiyingiana]NYI69845.1 ribosomal subunit interface protein [Naumannella cuiyingiana]
MDVVVTGRHCQVPEEFREHVSERVGLIEKLRDRVIRVEVLVSAGGHTKQPDQGSRVEITLIGKGPVVRAEASAQDKTAAFEQALDKLRSQLRKAHDRRRVSRGRRAPRSVAEATAELAELPVPMDGDRPDDQPDKHTVAGIEVTGGGPLVVREKTFAGAPMTLEQALDQMELLGHDFYLFVDAVSGLPSVVYRRRYFDYGVIHIDTAADADPTATNPSTPQRAASA